MDHANLSEEMAGNCCVIESVIKKGVGYVWEAHAVRILVFPANDPFIALGWHISDTIIVMSTWDHCLWSFCNHTEEMRFAPIWHAIVNSSLCKTFLAMRCWGCSYVWSLLQYMVICMYTEWHAVKHAALMKWMLFQISIMLDLVLEHPRGCQLIPVMQV